MTSVGMPVPTQVTAMNSPRFTLFSGVSRHCFGAALLLTVLLSLAGPTVAADAPLPAWEQLTPAQRDLLIAPMRERWNSVEPARRQNMLERARRWQGMSPEQRQRAQHGMKRWEDMTPAKREMMRALYSYMRTLDEPQRKAMMARWREMTPKQRRSWADQHPAPQPEAD